MDFSYFQIDWHHIIKLTSQIRNQLTPFPSTDPLKGHANCHTNTWIMCLSSVYVHADTKPFYSENAQVKLFSWNIHAFIILRVLHQFFKCTTGQCGHKVGFVWLYYHMTTHCLSCLKKYVQFSTHFKEPHQIETPHPMPGTHIYECKLLNKIKIENCCHILLGQLIVCHININIYDEH